MSLIYHDDESCAEEGARERLRYEDGTRPEDDSWLWRLAGAAALVAMSLSIAFPCGWHAC